MNKKWKKVFLWTSFVTASIGLVSAPIITSKNENINSVKLKQRTEILENKLFLDGSDILKNEQVDLFQNVSLEDVLNEVKNSNSKIYQNMKITRNSNVESNSDAENSFNHLNVYEEINKNIDQFNEIAKDVLSGEIEIREINRNLSEYKNNNPFKYEEILEKISETVDLEYQNENSLIDINVWDFNNSTVSNSKIKDIVIFDEKTNEKTILKADEIAFVLKSRKLLSRLIMYRDKTHGVSVASAVLTAASWAIAAFYWSAWWMFGANVPFAIGATIQAGLATYFTKESFDEYYRVRDEVKDLNSLLNSKDFFEYEEFTNSLLKICNENLKKGAINFSISLGLLTTYPRLIEKGFVAIFSKGIKFLTKKIYNWTFKFLGSNLFKKVFADSVKSWIKKLSEKINSYLLKLSSKKIAMNAVSWASTASAVISALDLVLGICSFGSDIAILNPRELNEW